MKIRSHHLLFALLTGGVSPFLVAGEISLAQCPDPVRETIREYAGFGRIDEVKTIRTESRILYVAEIDLPGQRERRVHVVGDGTLLKMVEEIRQGDLPRRVKTAIAPFMATGVRFDSADRVTTAGVTEYHVEMDLADETDLHLVLDESGGILRRREEADH